uniref:uncharacterized protein LOC104265600 isoform X1 n=1 Tax=Ciona intestinalis TaxID=7719 RepID=UPI000EF48ADF|nr:uncharacterized protein LOC104265600 isoform X1 [Ciona intestinalis]|eukprot:XP_002124230.2 uncharacterized protein LOC104265600 isoform X1 [Ciona intestinalis]
MGWKHALNDDEKKDILKILQEFGNYVPDRLESYVRPLVGLPRQGNQGPLEKYFCTSYGEYKVRWRIKNWKEWKGIDGNEDRDELQGALFQGDIVLQFASNTDTDTESCCQMV